MLKNLQSGQTSLCFPADWLLLFIKLQVCKHLTENTSGSWLTLSKQDSYWLQRYNQLISYITLHVTINSKVPEGHKGLTVYPASFTTERYESQREKRNEIKPQEESEALVFSRVFLLVVSSWELTERCLSCLPLSMFSIVHVRPSMRLLPEDVKQQEVMRSRCSHASLLFRKKACFVRLLLWNAIRWLCVQQVV